MNVQTYVYKEDTTVSDELSARILVADHVVIVSMTTSYSPGDPESTEIKMPLYLAYGYQLMTEVDATSGEIASKYGPNLPAEIDCVPANGYAPES